MTPVAARLARIAAAAGEAAAVHWCLLTTHSVQTAAQARQIVAWYQARWTIEQVFRTLKSAGSNAEESQLTQAGRFIKLAVAALIAAVRIMQLVMARDGSTALIAHVQLDEATSNRGVEVRVPGLRRDADYDVTWETPVDAHRTSYTLAIDPAGPSGGAPVSGAALADVGLWLPRCRPETIRLIRLTARS